MVKPEPDQQPIPPYPRSVERQCLMSENPTISSLKSWFQQPDDLVGADVYEYRLLLSGCAYNGDLEGDYTKASFGGLLLQRPFPLWKVGHSYDEYPQELAMWITVAPVTKGAEDFHSTSTPHEGVALDIAAILTLFLRRLVVVVGAASVTLPDHYAKPPVRSPRPQPLALNAKDTYSWPRLPLSVIYGPNGPTYKNPNVEDVPVSPVALQEFFDKLANHRHAERIIGAARLYHRAMDCLFRQTDVSYLLFVCAAEAAATAETQYREPKELLELPAAQGVRRCATALGIAEETIQELALSAVSDSSSKERSKGCMFREFLLKFGADHQNTSPLFNPDVLDLFKVPDEKRALVKAYKARSEYVHAANPFKESSLAGTSSGVSVDAFFDVLIGDTVAPSILWFERIVAHSIRRFITGGHS
jgi:hypothetical protein